MKYTRNCPSCGDELNYSMMSSLRTANKRKSVCKWCTSANSKNHNFQHGFSHHPIYTVWCGMKERCYNSNVHHFKHYGGRGITICPEWKYEPKTFCEWALANGWKKGLEIDRKNNDGNYEPDNCRFVSHRINTSNTRQNKRLLPRGVRLGKAGRGFQAEIRIHGKQRYLGTFNTPEKASTAYQHNVALITNLEQWIESLV